MQVDPKPPINLDPLAPEKKKGILSKLRMKIAAVWKKCFSSKKDPVQQDTATPTKLPPVTKTSLFKEANFALSNIQTLLIPEPSMPKFEEVKSTPTPPVVTPKKPPAGYKAVNPIVLKDFPDFKINIVHSDLFESDAEVIVNAANVALRGGGGIDGAIHTAGGPEYKAKHAQLKTDNPDFKEGDALIVEGVSLKSKKRDKTTRMPTAEAFTAVKDVIVVAGPNRQGHKDKKGIIADNDKLYNCYYNALLLAHDKGKSSIAFPAISVGIFAYPKDEAAKMSLKAINDFVKGHPDTSLKSINIHCFDPGKLDYSAELNDWKFYQAEINHDRNKDIFKQTISAAKAKKPDLTKAQVNSLRLHEIKEVTNELHNLAESLQKQLNQAPIDTPRKHPNPSHTCWMNSALQSLGNAYINSKNLKNLIDNDLMLLEDETYKDIENRFSSWAPLHLEEQKLEDLIVSQTKLEEQIEAEKDIESLLKLNNKLALVKEDIRKVSDFNEGNDNYSKYYDEFEASNDVGRKAVLQEDMTNLAKDLSITEDRVLFKWSFLLYMQACRYGTDKNVEDALKAHHRLCFAIARHPDFSSVPGPSNVHESHEISTYIQFAYEMLGLGFRTSFHKQYMHEGNPVIANQENATDTVIDVSLIGKTTFLDGLKQTFESKVNAELNIDGVKIPAGQAVDMKKIYGEPPQVITLNVNGEHRQTALEYDKDKKDKLNYKNVLDLSPYFDGNPPANYKIIGLTIHEQYKDGGHYYSYVRRKKEDNSVQWYKCNDSKITPVNESVVPFDKATTLTYFKCK